MPNPMLRTNNLETLFNKIDSNPNLAWVRIKIEGWTDYIGSEEF